MIQGSTSIEIIMPGEIQLDNSNFSWMRSVENWQQNWTEKKFIVFSN